MPDQSCPDSATAAAPSSAASPAAPRSRPARSPAFALWLLALALSATTFNGAAQTAGAASIKTFQTSLTLPAGSTTYVYGMATGGALPSSNLAKGQYVEASDADGIPYAALAVTASDSESFATGAADYTIGGIGVSGFTAMSKSYAVNNSPGSPSTSDAFVVSHASLVVVVAMAGGQSYLTLSGLPGLHLDASVGNPSGGVTAMAIGHAYLQPGAYTITENSRMATAPGQDPSHTGDLLGVFVFSGGSIPPAASGPDASTLRLLNGKINGQSVSPTDRTVTVSPSEAISGHFTVSINSDWHPGDVMAMGVTPTWGDPATSFVDLGGFGNPATGLERTVNLNLTAPSRPGTYYIVAAYNATFTAAQVMSGTNWSAGAAQGAGALAADWDTGDAIADWSPATILRADANGAVWARCLGAAGPNGTLPLQNQPCLTPATAIEIVVGSGAPPGTFNPTNSEPNTRHFSPSAFKIVNTRDGTDGASQSPALTCK